MSPCDSTGSPFAYVVRTRCTRSRPVKNPGLALPTTSLHARAAEMTPRGGESLRAEARPWPHPESSSTGMRIIHIQLGRLFIEATPLASSSWTPERDDAFPATGLFVPKAEREVAYHHSYRV